MAIYFFAAAGMFALFLYRRGLMTAKSITAAFFLFRPGKDQDQASLNSCSGWVRHMTKFRETGVYRFSLNLQLSDGSAEAILLDRKKCVLLHLNRRLRTGTAKLEENGRYFLHWDFEGATGTCELRWERTT